jgi:type VI protein secretion system component Hcp
LRSLQTSGQDIPNCNTREIIRASIQYKEINLLKPILNNHCCISGPMRGQEISAFRVMAVKTSENFLVGTLSNTQYTLRDREVVIGIPE